jgi:hypothetical protein
MIPSGSIVVDPIPAIIEPPLLLTPPLLSRLKLPEPPPPMPMPAPLAIPPRSGLI